MAHGHHPTANRAKGRDSDLFPRHDAPGGRTRRDRGLRDMSQDALAQLTSILIMPPDEIIAQPSEEWLKHQKERIKNADWPLRRKNGLAAKISILGRSLQWPSRTGRAELCTSHAQFDPPVIYDLRCLVVRMCNYHLERLRENYRGERLHPEVVKWLDRLECIRSVCLDENGINEQSPMDDKVAEEDSWWSSRPMGIVGGSLKKVQSHRVVKKGIMNLLGHNVPRRKTCAACICAAVGGDRSMLADLFAGVLARKKKKHRSMLFRVLECWKSHYDQRRQTRIQTDAMRLKTLVAADHLKLLVAEASEQREKGSRHLNQPKPPSFRSRPDDPVDEPPLRNTPERPVTELSGNHLDTAVSRSSWDVPVYLAPHVEDYFSSEEERPEIMRTGPLPGERTYADSDGCISSEEEYPEIIQTDPLQGYTTYTAPDNCVSPEEDYHRADLLWHHRAHAEDYAGESIGIMPTDPLQYPKKGTVTLESIEMRESAVPPPLKIDIPYTKTQVRVEGQGPREQSWATITVHTEQPSYAGFASRNGSPPPPLPFRSTKRPSMRPVSSAYGSDRENPSPCPSDVTSRLPFAPYARVKYLVDHNPKHQNQKALKALEGRASTFTQGDSFCQVPRKQR